MKSICEEKMCSGCMACVDVCPKDAISVEPNVNYYEPVIDQHRCINCGKCKNVCQQLKPFDFAEPISWFQGWDCNEESRRGSSSGGLASAISRGFIEHEGVVCACEFSRGRFGFGIADSIDELSRFKGSKYVKSDPSGIYSKVRTLLNEGRKVLFIGLPCQVSAMRKAIPQRLADNLYTVDLICHGSPSPKVLSAFLDEQELEIDNLKSISFRTKGSFQLKESERFVDVPGVVDAYSMAFLAGLDYTENCYSCAYATTQRVSDVTLGDSWGTELTDEMVRGVSLVLCQSEKGRYLLKWSGAELRDVDVEIAIQNNGQLTAPSKKPKSREEFLRLFEGGVAFSAIAKRCLPIAYYRQCLKLLLIKCGLLKRGGVRSPRSA